MQKMETSFRLRGPVVCSPYGCGFRSVFTGRAEHEPHQEKRACKTTLRGSRETRMLSGPLLVLLIGPMLIWMSLLALTDFEKR